MESSRSPRGEIARRRFHRAIFGLAGAYNLAWGAYSAVDPQWFFRFSGLPLSNTPEIFSCLGMVIVGLLGKVFGPIGAAVLIWRGEWPLKSSLLCVTNDFIWWVPFGLYLFDARTANSRASG